MTLTIFILLSCLNSSFIYSFNSETDSLCFLNQNGEFSDFGYIGEFSDKKGVCQGMSGLVSAFHAHAKFVPNRPKMSDGEAYFALGDLRHYHSGGCSSSKKVEIAGYKNLKEFCHDHKNLLKGEAILYNADIAVREISWNLASFLMYQDTPIVSNMARFKLHQAVMSFKKRLNAGKWPLMLYYSHVVAVHKMRIIKDQNQVIKSIKLALYDPNEVSSEEYTIEYSTDGLPKAGQKMLWDTTPSRLTTICW